MPAIRPILLASALLLGCKANVPDTSHDRAVRVVEALSADAMQGRKAGTEGAEMARDLLLGEIADIGFADTKVRPFEIDDISGRNLVLKLNADDGDTGPALIVMAHYDHLGVRTDGEVFNGADDNASGVGALISIAESYADKRPAHDTYLAWLDAEESGLTGAKALLAELLDRPMLVLNFDMIAQNADGVIYAAGTHHTPALKPVVERAAKGSGMDVRFGHDRPEYGPNDWTSQSDHGVFHAAGVPFVYLGVEDHPHYHAVTDDFATLPLGVYRRSLDLAVATARELDAVLPDVAKTPAR